MKFSFIFAYTTCLVQLACFELTFASAVSSSSSEASKAAMEILNSGGNAVDAACAAVFVLNVTQPHFSGIGGGGFALIHLKDKKEVLLDFRESAPSATTSRLFLQPDGKVIPGWNERNTGSKAVGIPGVVAGCGQAVRENGKLSWKQVLSPSIQLAQNGFVISQFFQEELSDQWKRISRFDFTRKLLQGTGGHGLKKDEILKQPLLAQTLERLAQDGPESFYTGKLAKRWLKEAQNLGVKFTKKDLESYHVYKRDPVIFSFGKFHGVTASAPSSAGLTVAGVLRYLDHYYSTHPISEPSSIERYVVAIEAKAFFGKVRDKVIADPFRMSLKPSQLLTPVAETSYWRQLDDHIQVKLSQLSRTKVFPSRNRTVDSFSHNRIETHTAHVSVVDDFGNAVALTSSVGNIFGSGIFLPKSGFVLNSTLGDFNPAEKHINSSAPLARPLSNMSPLFLFENNTPHPQLVGVLGAAGGHLIPSAIVDFIQNYYFYNMSKDAAIRFPRIHSEDGNEVAIEGHASSKIIKKIGNLGYRMEPIDTLWAVFEGIVRRSSRQNWEPVAETRYEGLGLTTQ